MLVVQTKSNFVPSCLLFDAHKRCQFWWNWFVPLASAIWYPNLAQGMGENELALKYATSTDTSHCSNSSYN